jgi:STE24 endopeptidase
MTAFALVFLAALALTTLLKLALAWRHAGYVTARRDRVPAAFAAEIPLEAHHKAADYTVARTRFGMLVVVVNTALVLWLTFGGLLQHFADLAGGWFDNELLRGLALLGLVGALMTVVELPLDAWRTFVIEARYGFNRTTPGVFALDAMKHLVLAIALGAPLAAVVLWLMNAAGAWWWLYAWGVWVVFNLVLLAVFPTWIAPLFNKFAPLSDDALKARIEQLLKRCGFEVAGFQVMDGSKRSSHGNAYFTGFGRTKRIVFFDTLLARLSPTEVEAVLAHELGHYRLHHVVKRIAWIFASSLLFLWALGQLKDAAWFYQGLGVTAPSTATALILFVLAVPAFTFLFSPLASAYSRKHEFEADRYAAQHANAGDLVSALVKLYKDNASTLTPDPVHSAFYDSHPPAALRIARLKEAAP